MHARFVRLVVESRKLPEERVRALADGRIYTADQALAAGLVDRLGYLDEVMDLAKKAAGTSDARLVMYHRPKEYRATIYSTAPPPAGESALGQLTGLMTSPGPRFMYLWWP